jgi:putative redox protein
VKARVQWLEGRAFVGEAGSGHGVVMDGSPEQGGRNLGTRPMEMILLGLGGCTAFDVVMILEKARQPITDCVVEIAAERAPVEPKVFTAIHLTYRVKGRGLSVAQVERAVTLSQEKYCSASLMLGQVAKLTYEFAVEEE